MTEGQEGANLAVGLGFHLNEEVCLTSWWRVDKWSDKYSSCGALWAVNQMRSVQTFVERVKTKTCYTADTMASPDFCQKVKGWESQLSEILASLTDFQGYDNCVSACQSIPLSSTARRLAKFLEGSLFTSIGLSWALDGWDALKGWWSNSQCSLSQVCIKSAETKGKVMHILQGILESPNNHHKDTTADVLEMLESGQAATLVFADQTSRMLTMGSMLGLPEADKKRISHELQRATLGLISPPMIQCTTGEACPQDVFSSDGRTMVVEPQENENETNDSMLSEEL